MPMRQPVPDFQTSEVTNPVAVQLGAGVVTSPSIVPTKAQGQSIVGMILRITATVTQTAIKPWQVSELFNSMRIQKGSKTLVNPQSFGQLQRLYNALTSLTDANPLNPYFSDPTNVGAVGDSTETLQVFLPLNFSTETPVVTNISLNGFAAVEDCTAGSVIISITYLYSSMQVTDDMVKIITAPAAIGANIDVDVSQYFSESRVINEVWFDVTADANLNSQRFALGSNEVYDAHNAFQLRAVTQNAPWMQSYAGFFAALDLPTVYPVSGSTASKPQLVLNLAQAVAPTFYLFMKP